MTAAEMSKYIGQTLTVACKGMAVDVKVIDARTRFGRVDLKVEPVSGAGTAWIECRI